MTLETLAQYCAAYVAKLGAYKGTHAYLETFDARVAALTGLSDHDRLVLVIGPAMVRNLALLEALDGDDDGRLMALSFEIFTASDRLLAEHEAAAQQRSSHAARSNLRSVGR